MSRPEHTAPPEVFYNDTEARKYTQSSRMIGIQRELTERALELLNLPESLPHGYLLDIGCGSGLSGDTLTEAGHEWVGMDISEAMLNVAVERGAECDVVLQDMGAGLNFRPGVFDGAISISAIQWLCNADKKEHSPKKRLTAFFQTLYAVLAVGGRAVLQFYPENADQLEFITSVAMRCGFSGGVVVDYPNSAKAKKYYLVLITGSASFETPQARGVEGGSRTAVDVAKRRKNKGNVGVMGGVSKREWVMAKKERQRKQGRDVRPNSKFTARTRNTKRF